LLEAEQTHIDGRIRTLRHGDMHGEQGAMRIPADHDLTRFYIGEMGLSLREFVQVNGSAFLRARGRKVKMADAPQILNEFDLTPQEKIDGDVKLWTSTITELVNALTTEEMADLWSDSPKTEKMRSFDRKSLYSLWAEHGFSNDAIQLLASTWNLETSMHISLTEHMREEVEGVWMERFDEVVGGLDKLPHSLSKSLRIKSGCPVIEIEQNNERVVALYVENGKVENIEADWIICTTPLGVLRRIKFSPSLSAKKMDAIRRVNYDSSTKVHAVAKKRFWELDDGIFGGGSVSDGSLGSTWYPSDNAVESNPEVSNSQSIFLASYCWGQTARRMSKHTASSVLVQELAELHDSLHKDRSLIEDYVHWSWDDNEWSRGAYAFFQPGEHSELFETLVAPEGRILLAGEHCSYVHSWIQGAIASGLRAANYIAEASSTSPSAAASIMQGAGGPGA
ncbi:MAG: FAD-dependent oxidoreductase, partial [Candidatus Obscuribacterales bacterium]|nr:FAD-dependent oxidoreductase [Candidatus Obscuribacterales bacterium]